MSKKEKHIHEHIHHEVHMKVRNIGVLYVLAWVVGVIFIIWGAMELLKHPVAGILIILGSIIILPPFRELIEKKFHFQLSGWLIFVLFLILLGNGISISKENVYSTNVVDEPEIQAIDSIKIEPVEEARDYSSSEEAEMSVTVNTIKKQNIIGDCGEYGLTCNKAKPGKIFVILDILVKNNGVTEYPENQVSPYSFNIKDNEGYVYDVTYTSYLEQALPSGELKNGDIIRGKIAFEIPNNANGLKLIFWDSSISLRE